MPHAGDNAELALALFFFASMCECVCVRVSVCAMPPPVPVYLAQLFLLEAASNKDFLSSALGSGVFWPL